MANNLKGKGRVKPNHPPPPPPVPRPQSLTQEQVESAEQKQPDEKLHKNTENSEKTKPDPAKDLYTFPDGKPLHSSPNELTPPVSRRPKPVRPPPPSRASLRRWVSEGTGVSVYKEVEPRPSLRPSLRPGASVYKEAKLRRPLRPSFGPGASVYKEAKLRPPHRPPLRPPLRPEASVYKDTGTRPPLMRQTETETDSEQLRPDDPSETKQPDDLTETKQPDDLTETKQPDDLTETKQPDDLTETKQPDDLTETKQPDDLTETKQPDDLTETKQPDDLTETTQPDGASETKQPDGASETTQPDGASETTPPEDPSETTQSAQSDSQSSLENSRGKKYTQRTKPQMETLMETAEEYGTGYENAPYMVVSPALPPEEYHSSKVLTRQGSMEDLKEEGENPLYVDVLEEPLYIDPDELNLPIFKGKHKPSRPPPPSSASVRYSPAPGFAPSHGHSLSMGSSPAPGFAPSHGHSLSMGSSPAPDWYKVRALQRLQSGQSGPGDHHTTKTNLHPQLSLPSRLPTARSPQQSLLSKKNELDMLMEWWSTAKCWEKMYKSDIDHQVQEQNKQTLFLEAQRVRLALNLFECLLFHRGQIFNSHITQLYGLADKLDETKKKAKVAGITGGSVAAATGIILAPFTLGLSLTATAIGVGVAVGGAKGGSSTITDKWYSGQERRKVEEILQEHQAQMEDVEGCLQFINAGAERLRKFEAAAVQDVDEEVVKMTRVAQILGKNLAETQPASSPTRVLQGFAASMDIYFKEEQKLKKDSETKLARKMRELAKQMKIGLDQLMQVRNRIRAAVEQVETQEQR